MTCVATMQERIAALARQALSLPSLDASRGTDHSERMAPWAVLALEGNHEALGLFLEQMLKLSDQAWGVHRFGSASGLNDSFTIRAIVEAYRGLIDAGHVPSGVQAQVAPWLHELASIRVDGRIQRLPGFAGWHLRNQNVPASMVYEIAALLDQTQPRRFDTAPLWNWADGQMVGWDLTWRTPDDSWLYQFIWVWSAYRHAALRRPDLLTSENARRSFDFYKTLSIPGGIELIFGEARPMEMLGPTVCLLLGASLLGDGQMLWIAQELWQRQERHADHWMLAHRGPEFYRIYQLWPRDLAPIPPQRRSTLLLSPLAGRGWSLGGSPYNDDVKRADRRFPAFGRDTCDLDDLYQARDPAAYATLKPDKVMFGEGNEVGGMYALLDLRAQGLHDHPDALGISVLHDQGVPWLVESGYLPRDFNRQRWLHNVPLYRRGSVPLPDLLSWRSDTWREPSARDVAFHNHGGRTEARVTIPSDAFDYVNFDGNAFDVERAVHFQPDSALLVVDTLTAAEAGVFTVGQIWHTTAAVERAGLGGRLQRDGRTLHMAFAHSTPMQWHHGSHAAPEVDPLYFLGPVQDLLWHTTLSLRKDQQVRMVALFSRQPMPEQVARALT